MTKEEIGKVIVECREWVAAATEALQRAQNADCQASVDVCVTEAHYHLDQARKGTRRIITGLEEPGG